MKTDQTPGEFAVIIPNLYKNAFFKKYFSLVNYITKIKFLMELVEKPKLNKFKI